MGLFILGIAALLSGLFIGLKDLIPYLRARRTGVILRKGALNVSVRRDADPEGFARLMANRSRGAVVGFGLSMAGAAIIGLFLLAFAGVRGPLALLIFAVYLGFAIFAAICLIRGFATGNMFSFWSLTLFGEANRKRNPIWFWTYAGLNLLIVLSGLSTIAGIFSR